MNMVHSVNEAISLINEIIDNSEGLLTRTTDDEAAAMLAIVEINKDKDAYGKYLMSLIERGRNAITLLQTPTNAQSA